jgi:hypothetical protein
MKKILLLFMHFRYNLSLNILYVTQCIFIFLLINSTISSLIYDAYIDKYVIIDKDTTLFLSNVVANNVKHGNIEEFYNLIDSIKNVEGVKDVGYQINEYIIGGSNNHLIINSFYINDGMSKIQYPLKQGRWFNKIDSNVTEVIIGGDISNLYNINDEVTLSKITTINETIQYMPIRVKIIGKLEEPIFFMDLNFSSNQPDYTNLFSPYANLILTNDSSIISNSNINYPMLSLIVNTDRTSDISNVKKLLSNFGQSFDFNEINEFNKDRIEFNLINKLPTSLIMLIGILSGITGITFLTIHKNMKTLSTYYIYGLSRTGCIYLNIALNITIICFSFIFAILLYFIPGINKYLFNRSLLGSFNIIFSIGFIISVILITLFINLKFIKNSPFLTLRRFE